MVSHLARARLDARVLVHDGAEPDLHLEVPDSEYGCEPDGACEPCALSRDEPRWRDHCYGCGGRDVAVLECVPEEGAE